MKKIDKLNLTLKLINEHNLTAYEIGKNTKISTFAVSKIINGETKNPNETTLDVILNFIEGAILGTDIKPKETKEPEEKYSINPNKTYLSEYHKCLEEQNASLKYIGYLKSLLIKNNIKFEE